MSSMDLEDQLSKAKMKILKLNREKKALLRQIDEFKQREAKLNTKLSWLGIQNKRDERERKIRERRRLRDMQLLLKEDSETEQKESFITRDMAADHPELAEALDMVFSLEANIQSQLEQINVDTIETENAKQYLDTSFETISLLIEQTRQQRSAIMTLREQINEIKKEKRELESQLEGRAMEGTATDETNETTSGETDHMSDVLSTHSLISEQSDRLRDLEQQVNDADEIIKKLEDLNLQKEAEIGRLKRSFDQQIENVETEKDMEIMKVRQEARMHVEEISHTRSNEARDLANDLKLKTREVELKEEEIQSLLTLQKTLQEQIGALKSQVQHLSYQLQDMKGKLERRERHIRNMEMKSRTNASTVACHCWGS